ncbi:MAG: primosomal protein N' [Pseudomonadota bacterium]
MSLDLLAVALPVPVSRAFDYLPPADAMPPLPGMRVSVPFGKRNMVGLVVGLIRRVEADGRQYKMIVRVLDAAPIVPPEWLAALRWASAYYQHPLGEVIAAALPAALRAERVPELRRQRQITITTPGLQALASLPPRSARLRASLQALAAAPLILEHGQAVPGFDAAQLRRARAEGWVAETALAAPQALMGQSPGLTSAQQQALQALRTAEGFTVSLLEGVTGSGKTELYLRLAEEALSAGQQVLVLCPEIGLTPQLTARFRERFGPVVAGFHSGMGDADRAQSWLAIRENQARILVGTRSAVFAPFADLGLVIVDEEHDASYKQQEGFRYHARDLALVRAKSANAAVVLGSATPALETLANAKADRYRHVRLSERIASAAPPVAQLIDVNHYPTQHGLSEPLAAAIERHLVAGGQALLFINRRGYAPTLLCDTCHWIAPCPRCDARLNLHRGEGAMRCHHCGYFARPPRECPSCGGKQLVPVGEGAERVEEALKNRFPGRRIERFDTDRLRAAGKLEALLDDVHARRVDVLVGTQMLAKGHDFPALSLVGVVNADQALFSSDFRALERLGQLLTQVAGRAGRSAASPIAAEVLIQTREPKHPSLVALLRDGYGALAETLLRERADAGLPPSAHLALLRVEAADRGKAEAFLNAAKAVFPNTRSVQLLGPAPAPMERRDGRARAQLLLTSALRPALQRALAAWLPQVASLPGAKALRWSIDVDPVDLF